MKRFLILILWVSALIIPHKALSQGGFECFTDRNVYTSGETVMAKIYLPEGTNARIVYLDLLNLSGKRIVGAALEIRNNEADGYLQLPDSLSSSTYILRVFLKKMAGNQTLMSEIWISNRFDGLEKTSHISRVSSPEYVPVQRTDQVQILGVDAQYPTNKDIQATVRIGDELRAQIVGQLLIGVALTSRQFDSGTFTSSNVNQTNGLIDNKGIRLSGTVFDKKDMKPASGITVLLTIPDSIPGFQYDTTGDDGKYYFRLDKYYGQLDAVIQCMGNQALRRLKLTVDNPFDEIGQLPEISALPIPDDFRKSVSDGIDVLTFQRVFDQGKMVPRWIPKVKSDAYPFYGKATKTVDPQLFTNLPDFNEISKELLPGVKFRNYNNEPSIFVINSASRSFFTEKPWILIDGIPIFDLNLIKNMGTDEIDRIDILTSERYYGDLRFPGVVALYSTKADYSGIPESDQLIRLNIEAIQIPADIPAPELNESNIPDLRQVIYWNCNVSPEQAIGVNFRTSSVTGPFKLVVKGRLSDGTFFQSEKHFDVKQR